MTKYPYIVAREQRLAADALGRQRFMGGTICVMLWLVSLFQFYLVTGHAAWLDLVWHSGIWLAVSLFILVMWRPTIIAPIEKVMKAVGHFVGGLLMKIVLTVLYFLVVTPLGLMMQRFQRKSVFLSWDTTPEVQTLWEAKKNTADKKADKQVPVYFFPFYLVYVMAQNKAYFVIPLIINLLLIAMLVFFVQTPVVAPFVYTVF